MERYVDNLELMVDIETLGTKPGCVVLSAAYIPFNPKVHQNMDMLINAGKTYVFPLLDSVLRGLKMETGTLQWWKKTDNLQTAKYSAHVDGTTSLKEALMDFDRDMWSSVVSDTNKKDKIRVWSKSPNFDMAILQAAYEAAGLKFEVPYWNMMDVRTLRNFFSIDDQFPKNNFVEHEAINDAAFQCLLVQRAYGILNAPTEAKKIEPKVMPKKPEPTHTPISELISS